MRIRYIMSNIVDDRYGRFVICRPTKIPVTPDEIPVTAHLPDSRNSSN
jgi:hypothetical protein